MSIRKGVLLAGGFGTRLHPMTKVTNKHLLPVYDRPVIYYAIDKMVGAGIDHIMIVTNPGHVDDFVNIIGSGPRWISKHTGKQIQVVYGIQEKPTGIADGLWIAKEYIGDDDCMLYLGDNIIQDDLAPYVEGFTGGATVFLKEVHDPERFGVAELDAHGHIVGIEEKPGKPKSNLAVIGVYLYENAVFKKMIGMEPSDRGEYEITTINSLFCSEGTLNGVVLQKPWFDIGTFDSLLRASQHMKEKGHSFHCDHTSE
jgi:glucose-1-phosphate thymidylyltransferase